MAPIDLVEGRNKPRKDHGDRSEKKSKKRKHDVVQQPSSNPSPTKKGKSGLPVNESSSQPELDIESHEDSPFHHQTLSLYVGLSPITQLQALRGICAEYLSPLVLTYYPPLQGVILSYSNPRVSNGPRETSDSEAVLAKHVDEYGVSLVWVTADFVVFKPQKNGWIKGWVNLQNEGHIGLVCWNLFNASIDRRNLPKSWKWVYTGGRPKSTHTKGAGQSSDPANSQETQEFGQYINGHRHYEGYFVDKNGNKVEGELKFRIKDIDATAGADREKNFLSIEGSLLSLKQERKLREDEMADNTAVSQRSRPGANGNGVLKNGTLSDEGSEGRSSPDPKAKKKKRK